jgi:hypothetical protein
MTDKRAACPHCGTIVAERGCPLVEELRPTCCPMYDGPRYVWEKGVTVTDSSLSRYRPIPYGEAMTSQLFAAMSEWQPIETAIDARKDLGDEEVMPIVGLYLLKHQGMTAQKAKVVWWEPVIKIWFSDDGRENAPVKWAPIPYYVWTVEGTDSEQKLGDDPTKPRI